jgi:hypothetical protein
VSGTGHSYNMTLRKRPTEAHWIIATSLATLKALSPAVNACRHHNPHLSLYASFAVSGMGDNVWGGLCERPWQGPRSAVIASRVRKVSFRVVRKETFLLISIVQNGLSYNSPQNPPPHKRRSDEEEETTLPHLVREHRRQL